jgi:hypothetical protein
MPNRSSRQNELARQCVESVKQSLQRVYRNRNKACCIKLQLNYFEADAARWRRKELRNMSQDLRAYLARLEQQGELIRVRGGSEPNPPLSERVFPASKM